MNQTQPRTTAISLSVLPLALVWTVTLYISDLTTIVANEFLGDAPPWLFWSKVALLAGLAVLGFVWRPLQSLRPYFLIFLVIYLASDLTVRLAATPWWQSRFPGGAPFAVSMAGIQFRRLSVALAVLVALWAMRYRRADYFLVKGQLDATGAPIRWLGITRPYSYRRFGPLAALCISLGLLLFLVVGGGWPRVAPGALTLVSVAAVFVLAAANAFYENVCYRAAPLATLHQAIAPQQAMLIVAVYFGLGHFYGVPYGLLGVAMAGALGWILNKTMLETKGFFWPWFIHFCQDALVFGFMALGAVGAGG